MLPAPTDTRVKNIQGILLFFLAVSITGVFISAPFSDADPGTMNLEFKKDGLSAQIEQSSLKTVIEAIAEKTGIWVKGAENLSNHTYSVEFEDIRIREAFERMLEPFNCCYFIDPEGEVLGVIIVSKKSRRISTQRRIPTQRRPLSKTVYRGSRKR